MKESKNYKWVVVGLLWMVALLNYLDRQMLATMRPSMQMDIHELKSATNFGYLMGIFLWVYGIMSPISGIIADKVNRKWLIVGSLFVWSAVTYGMGLATTFHQVYCCGLLWVLVKRCTFLQAFHSSQIFITRKHALLLSAFT